MRHKLHWIKDIYFYLSGLVLEVGFGVFIIVIGILITWLVNALI